MRDKISVFIWVPDAACCDVSAVADSMLRLPYV
jgi:hypothetical protein